MDPEILKDLKVLSLPEYEKVGSGVPSSCTHAHLASAWTIERIVFTFSNY
jgi:hypothetical protein